MTAKFLHIRACNDNGELLPTGGMTIAYTVSGELNSIFLHFSQCSVKDRFSRKIGRKVAEERLKTETPEEILDLFHPVSETIRWWFSKTFKFSLYKSESGPWMSPFIEEEETTVARYFTHSSDDEDDERYNHLYDVS